jgi:hypothetical protein
LKEEGSRKKLKRVKRAARSRLNKWVTSISLLLLGMVLSGTLQAAPAMAFLDEFKDRADGALDLSYWLAEKKGFLPILIPITEPAIGYGLGGAAMFLHQSIADLQSEAGKTPTGKAKPPSITAVGGMATENGSWGFGGGHLGIWAEDRLRYLGGIGGASVNLKYYGIGDALGNDGKKYTLSGGGLAQELSARLGVSDFFAGARYTFFRVKSRFDTGEEIPEAGKKEFTSNNGGLGAILGYDSRDNIFTPNRGINAKVRTTFYGSAFGGDFQYQKVEGFCIGYLDLHPKVVLGLRVDGKFSFGDVPFYALPFIDMRGVPVMKYQGKDMVLAEMEAWWNFLGRWSVVGFSGAGRTAANFENLGSSKTVFTQGAGLRYRIARLFGMDAGIDVAHGPGEWAFYIQVGSAWARSL